MCAASWLVHKRILQCLDDRSDVPFLFDAMLFNVVAYFAPPIAGRRRASTMEGGRDSIVAETPEAAGRMFFWRLGSEERAATWRIIVWSHKPHHVMAAYDGPTLIFERKGGQLNLIETREAKSSA